MNVENKMINKMNKELNEYDQLNNNSKILNHAYQDFSIYFKNKSQLEFSLQYNILISEYVFFVKYFKDSIFELFLYEMVQLFNTSFNTNKTETLNFISLWHANISKAIRNSAQGSHLERNKSELNRIDLYTKAIFAEIGDIIESILKYYVKLFYGLSLIIKNNKNVISNVDLANLGTCINTLAKYYEDFKIIYIELFEGVPIHQWRNIANHCDYDIDYKNNTIIAHYGLNPGNNIELTKKDLEKIAHTTFIISYLHKIAITIIYIDNSSEIDLKLSDLMITEDTLIMHIIEVAYIEGFKTINFEQKSSVLKFEFYDQKNTKDEIVFDQRINNITVKLYKLINNKTTMVFRGNIEKEVTIHPDSY